MPCIAQPNRPLLLQGTLTTFRRRCGKPTCRCAAAEPHESPALRFTEDGRTKTLTLTTAEVAQVTAALARYERAKADLQGKRGQFQANVAEARASAGGGRLRQIEAQKTYRERASSELREVEFALGELIPKYRAARDRLRLAA